MIGFLASYAYFKKDDIATLKSRLYGAPLFADSGAFSAWNLGLDLRIGEYAKWLLKAYDKWEVYANLDVIYEPAKTYANQKYLEGRVLRPMPVIHMGTSMDELKKYIDEGHDYIGLGGLANRRGVDPAIVKKWADDCFATADGKTVFHGFAFVRQNALTEYPWYSVDSSTWIGAERFGTGALFVDGRIKTLAFSDKKAIAENADAIKEHGGALERFLDGNYNYRDSTEVSVIAYKKLSDWWADKVPPVKRLNSPNAVVGPLIYLAGSGTQQVSRAAFTIEKFRRANA